MGEFVDNIERIKIIESGGKFFDFFDEKDNIFITNYGYLNKEIIIANDEYGEKKLILGENKVKSKIESIDGLKSTFNDLVEASIQIFNNEKIDLLGHFGNFENEDGVCINMPEQTFCVIFSGLDKDLLIKQLIFDVLWVKYLKESKKKTLFDYVKYRSSISLDADEKAANDLDNEAKYKKLKRAMEEDYKRMQYADFKDQYKALGVDDILYGKYCTPIAKDNVENKKPIFFWDHLYFNRIPRITYRQYKREFELGSNYFYKKVIEDLNKYNEFLKKLLPKDKDKDSSSKKYFTKTMDYFHLESYKRIDYMFRVANVMSKIGITEIDKGNFIIHPFHPVVLYAFEDENKLGMVDYIKPYSPLLLIEEALQQQIKNNKLDINLYSDQIIKYQYVRAKAFELFKYHAEFDSKTYDDINSFISQCYNMISYHTSNEFWGMIENKEWDELDAGKKRQIKNTLKKVFAINNALFGKLPEQ